MCARFQACPRDSHLKAAKCILRYLKKTGNMVLFYLAGDTFDLVDFADVDFAGYQVDKKSTFGMTHFLGSLLISWGTKKQNSVALSTAEAEYGAAVEYFTIVMDQAKLRVFWCNHQGYSPYVQQ